MRHCSPALQSPRPQRLWFVFKLFSRRQWQMRPAHAHTCAHHACGHSTPAPWTLSLGEAWPLPGGGARLRWNFPQVGRELSSSPVHPPPQEEGNFQRLSIPHPALSLQEAPPPT